MKTLLLRIENHATLPNGGPVSLRLAGTSAQVGRRAGMDWVLPDASRHISGHHFDITYRDGRYYISDLSANGTFRHGERYRLESQHEIGEGDRYTVGHYILRASFEADANTPLQPAPPPPPAMPSPAADDDWADFTPAPPRHDPYAEQPAAPNFGPNSGPNPGQDYASQAPLHHIPVPPIPEPLHPAPPLDHGWGMPPQDPHHPPVHAAIQAPMPSAAPGQMPVQTPPQAYQPAPPMMSPPVAPPPPPPASDAFLAAFLQGAGLPPDTKLAIAPDDLGRMFGQTLRISTEELMKMLQDRAAVKMFFSKEDRTMLSASGNNPMKFLPDSTAAMIAMFCTPRDGYMTGPEGFNDALTDVRLHQAAVVGALQPALAQMMEGLSPEEIEDHDAGGRFTNKAKKNWDEFVKRWDAKAASGDHGMLDAFISAFARHYSDAKTKLTSGSRTRP